MKYILSLILTLFLVIPCYAERVVLEKATGKLISYQSGNVNDPISIPADIPENKKQAYIDKIKFERLNSLKQDALKQGYAEADIKVKEITLAEWAIIEEEQFRKPAREKAQQEELARKQKEAEIKSELGWTDAQFKKLKEALGD